MNSNLQQKLFEFEAAPPAKVWEKIAGSLDAGEEPFSQRLFQYEEQPPLTAWAAIEAKLEEPARPAKVLPFFVRNKTTLRYIAAASIIAALLVSTTLLVRRTGTGSLAGETRPTSPAREASITKESKAETTIESKIPVTASSGEPKRDVVAAVKRTLAYIRPQNIFTSLSINKHFIPGQADAKALFDVSSLDNFMVYSDDDGNVMKVPKKLFSLVNCPSGDGSCKERIRDLQQKLMAQAAPASFTGMLELLHQLQ